MFSKLLKNYYQGFMLEGIKEKFWKFLIWHIFKLVIEKKEKKITEEIQVINMSKQANALSHKVLLN